MEKETRKNNKGLDLERLYQETLPSFVLDYFHIFYELQEHSVEFPSPYILRNYYMNNVTIKLHYFLHYAILECNMTSSASALVELPLFSTKPEAAMSINLLYFINKLPLLIFFRLHCTFLNSAKTVGAVSPLLPFEVACLKTMYFVHKYDFDS